MIHLYYGDGKGKTTAAMGLALRCAGSGKKVRIYQFLKDNSSSERNALHIIDGIEIIPGKDCEKFVFEMSESEKKTEAKYCSEMLKKIFCNLQGIDMLILDEVTTAITCGLLDEVSLLDLLEKHGKNTEVVMTGGIPSERILQACDYVTHMKKVKHPFDEGASARLGVEF